MGGGHSGQSGDLRATACEPVKPHGAPDSSTIQPILPFGAVSFGAKEVVKDMSSRVQLSVRCEELSKVAPTLVVLYSKLSSDEHWSEIGMSEVSTAATRSPVFDPEFKVDFRAEVKRLVRFEVYRVRDRSCLQELIHQKFVGMAEALLVDVVTARNQGNGWLTKELLNPKPKPGQYTGRLAIWAEEEKASKYMASFNLVGKGLKSTDLWKRKADPYAVIHRTLTIPSVRDERPEVHDSRDADEDEDLGPGLKCMPVYHTEVQRRTNAPRFQRVELTSAQLCMNDMKQEIVVEFFDFFRVRRHQYMGEAIVTFGELNKCHQVSKPLEVPICFREGPRVKHSGTHGEKFSPPGSRETTKDSIFRSSKSKDRTGSKNSKGSKGSKNSRGNASRESGSKDRGSTKDRGGTKDTRITASSDSSRTSGESSQLGPARICGPVMGRLVFEEIGVERRYSFLDYIRGGLELRLMVAVDFSRSNAGPGNPGSCHFSSPERLSAYATAIRSVGDVMKAYTGQGKFTAFGFGAKIPPSHTVSSDCFSLNGDFFDPEIDGVEGVLKAYQKALQIVHLHGPTRLAEVIKLANKLSKPYAQANASGDNGVDMIFQVLLILTDGTVDDKLETVANLAAAGNLPMATVIVGVGEEDSTFMRDLVPQVASHRDKMEAAAPEQEPDTTDVRLLALRAQFADETAKVEELAGPSRNLVRYVSYREYRDKPSELAAAALAELPREVVGFYTGRNVKPRGLEKMEDKEGNPIPKVIPADANKRNKSTAAASKASSSSALAKLGREEGGEAGMSSPLHTSRHKKLERLPKFIQDDRARLSAEAEELGYDPSLVKRAFREGIPSGSLDVLIDNIVHAGYGRLPCYKTAAENALPEVEITLPGQPLLGLAAAQMSWGLTSQDGAPRHSMLGPLPSESRLASRSILVHSREATKERQRTKDLNISFDLRKSVGGAGEDQAALLRKAISGVGTRTSSSSATSVVGRISSNSTASPVPGAAPEETGAAGSDGLCGVCLEAPVATELLPCRHRVACEACAAELGLACPLCQGTIRQVLKLR